MSHSMPLITHIIKTYLSLSSKKLIKHPIKDSFASTKPSKSFLTDLLDITIPGNPGSGSMCKWCYDHLTD